MVISGKEFAGMCDVGIMNTCATKSDMERVAAVAIEHNCCAIFGLKCWAPYLKELISGTDIDLEFSISGKPGSDDIEVKKFGAKRYVELGLTEVEAYLNFSYLKSGMYKEAVRDIAAVREVIPKDMIYKVIIQTPLLSDEEIKTACEIVVDGGADFVKTGNAEYGITTLHAVELISKTLNGRAQIKAVGPFACIDDIYKFLDLGATRFGITVDNMLKMIAQADLRVGTN